MELSCYSYDGGAPPMDSWPQEEKMGVASRRLSTGLIKAIRPLWLVSHLAMAMSWVGCAGHLNAWRSRKSLPLSNEHEV